MSGILYLISVPIGNYEDISARALRILKEVDLILCEEYKEGKKFLRQYGINKPLLSINEHNESEQINEILALLKDGKNIGLISDHGTPLLEDPGNLLVKHAIQEEIKITTIPGSSSVLSGLILSGFDTKKFLYYGLLSPNREKRKQELFQLKNFKYTLILLDAPYRVVQLLKAIEEVFGKDREICLASSLTMEYEKIFRGRICNVIKMIEKESVKKFEFVLIIKGNKF